MKPKDQGTPRMQSVDEAPRELVLHLRRKIGEHYVAAEDEIEPLIGHRGADVLVCDSHCRAKGFAHAVFAGVLLERLLTPRDRQLFKGARPVAGSCRTVEQDWIDIGCEHAQLQAR